MSTKTKNPFHVLTPELLNSQEMVDLFVSEHTDLEQITAPGHTIVTGPRGVGKSMMFRYLMSDCQIKTHSCQFSELNFCSIYLPVKNMPYAQKQTNLLRLEQHNYAYAAISEHMMVISIALLMIEQLLELGDATNCIDIQDMQALYQHEFLPVLSLYEQDNAPTSNLKNIFLQMKDKLNRLNSDVNNFVNSVSFESGTQGLTKNYEGLLLDYFNFLQPFVKSFLRVKGMPKKLFLLIDDAHMLSVVQTEILNMWISTRTSNIISIKISTEYRYKSFYTINGSTIDTPHDYTYLDLGTIYTAGSGRTNYRKRVSAIVERRFSIQKIEIMPEEFFPVDEGQERKIKEIEEKYIRRHEKGDGRGSNKHDDAYRYARPDYIRSLRGISKNSSTYSYSGFRQLVDLSSGAVRSFLQPAHAMFVAQRARQDTTMNEITHIDPGVQSEIMRTWAEDFLNSEMAHYKKESGASHIPVGDWDKLRNLIVGFGGLFRLILLSTRSERRVFSFALSDPENITHEVRRIIDIGVNWGYFHRSTIGRKDSKFGLRTELYVMNRRLAPNWNLDPTGFAGYLFVKSELLEDGMSNPASMLRRIDKNWSEEANNSSQLSLLDLEPGLGLLGISDLVTFPDGEEDDYGS